MYTSFPQRFISLAPVGRAVRLFWSLMLYDMYKQTIANKSLLLALREDHGFPSLSFNEYKSIVFGSREGLLATCCCHAITRISSCKTRQSFFLHHIHYELSFPNDFLKQSIK